MKCQPLQHGGDHGADRRSQRLALRVLCLLLVAACAACEGAIVEARLSAGADPSLAADAEVPDERVDAGAGGRKDASTPGTTRDAGGSVTPADASVSPPITGELDHGLLGAY